MQKIPGEPSLGERVFLKDLQVHSGYASIMHLSHIFTALHRCRFACVTSDQHPIHNCFTIQHLTQNCDSTSLQEISCQNIFMVEDASTQNDVIRRQERKTQNDLIRRRSPVAGKRLREKKENQEGSKTVGHKKENPGTRYISPSRSMPPTPSGNLSRSRKYSATPYYLENCWEETKQNSTSNSYGNDRIVPSNTCFHRRLWMQYLC